VAALALGSTAVAGPHSEVSSAFDKGDRFDLNVRVDYELTLRSAAIKREDAGGPGAVPNGPIPVVPDLLVSSRTHALVPRLEMGIFKDLAVTASLPVVFRKSLTLESDTRANRATTIDDGLLPAEGFDAQDPGGPGFAGDDARVFRSPNRAGLDQLHLGLVWAPMNQRRDDTKPTWKVGAEVRLAIGKTMRLDRANPDNETGVSRGVHELNVYTSLAKRIGWAEPFFEMWLTAPVGETNDSAFRDLGFGQRNPGAQIFAGTKFGVEAVIFERPGQGQRVSFLAQGDLTANFEGRAYTDMWEVFQYAGTAQNAGPLVLDADPLDPGNQAITHPGVTTVENHMTVGGRSGFMAELGSTVRVMATFALLWDQGHLLSFEDAGVDGPNDADEIVTPGTVEVNPAHAPIIDSTGRRYRVDEALNYVISVSGRVLF
jgi:hypothetical protein